MYIVGKSQLDFSGTVYRTCPESLFSREECPLLVLTPANRRHWTNAGLMLAHRLRRWLNIKPALGVREETRDKWKTRLLRFCEKGSRFTIKCLWVETDKTKRKQTGTREMLLTNLFQWWVVGPALDQIWGNASCLGACPEDRYVKRWTSFWTAYVVISEGGGILGRAALISW